MAKILLVEDETDISELVSEWLAREHHVVEVATSGEEALDIIRVYPFDVLILDWVLPGISGVDVCRHYRSKGGRSPILMLTAKKDVDEKETGLDAGADDYLTKPFDMRELLMRINALLRRPSAYAGDIIEGRGIILDTSTRIAHKGGEKVELTAKEFELLEFLMKRPDQYFSVDDLLDQIWTSESESSELAARQLIRRLRKKIESDGEEPVIVTSKGLGYKFKA